VAGVIADGVFATESRRWSRLLRPGEDAFSGGIIATGSPAGVAFLMKPPGFLKPGDGVKCEIEGVGEIENRVRAETV
jgi:hypothetical protein